MRKFILMATAVVATLGMAALATPGNAAGRQWCSNIRGVVNCMYATHDQCRASTSGRGGSCFHRHH